jgi:hypothetical protein
MSVYIARRKFLVLCAVRRRCHSLSCLSYPSIFVVGSLVWFLSLDICLLFLNILLNTAGCQVIEIYSNLSLAIIFLALSFVSNLSFFRCFFVSFLFFLFHIHLLFFCPLVYSYRFSSFPFLITFTLVALWPLEKLLICCFHLTLSQSLNWCFWSLLRTVVWSKVKVRSVTGTEGPYSLVTSALEGGGWSSRLGQFTPGKDPVPIVQEAGWASGPVWTCAKNRIPTGIRSPARPARSQSLYRLSYPGPHCCIMPPVKRRER